MGISGSSNPISEADRDRALLAVAQEQVAEDQTVMHRFVQSYAVDDEPVQNPLWLHGNRLSIEVLTVSVAEHLCTAFRHAASKAGVEIAGVVLESVGAAQATLSQDERDMGVALLDLGAGTCDIAVFQGPMRHVEEIPLGGDDINARSFGHLEHPSSRSRAAQMPASAALAALAKKATNPLPTTRPPAVPVP